MDQSRVPEDRERDSTRTTATALWGVRVLAPDGSFSAPRRIAWRDGRFTAPEGPIPASAAPEVPRSATHGLDARGVESRGRDPRGLDPRDPNSGDPDPRAHRDQRARGTAVPGPGPLAQAGAVAPGGDVDATGLWLIPGLVDAHVHAAWHAFDAPDRERLSAAETRGLTAAGLTRSLAAGVTAVRDAGGLSPAALAELTATGRPRPRVQLSVRMLDRAAADAAGGLDRAVDAVLADGARWIKLVATAGVAAPAGAGLDSHFSAAEFRDAVGRAERAGAGVMVHAWGGAAIDHAIAAGATSLEHGIFLTPEQTRRAAGAGLTLVPTLRIYHLVQRMIADGALPAAFRRRVDEAVLTHPSAVLRARDAGLPLALGTDSGTPEQHGTLRLEFDALVAAGLSPAEALRAATQTGAELLSRGEPPAAHAPGTLTPGAPADAVLLRRDPREPGALSDPAAVVRVLHAGVLRDPAELRAPAELRPPAPC